MDSSSRFTALLFTVVILCLPFRLAADDTVYTKVDVNPVPVRTPPPDYPESMKRQGISGVVAVAIVIDETGVVTSAAVAKSTQSDFEAPALAAVKKWKFKPAKKDGTPVKIKVTVPIRFDLEDK
jgi:protein TonB